MAKKFEPQEIYDRTASANGFGFDQVKATLEHYGFIAIYRNGGHLSFKHREYRDIMHSIIEEGVYGTKRDYHDLALILPRHSDDVREVDVKKAADACLKVKELNARRRVGENLQQMPDWVAPTLDRILKDDNTPKFEQRLEHDALRLFREPDGEARRSYRIVCNKQGKKQSLEVKSLNFPEFGFTFSLNGDRNPQDQFLRMFDDMDGRVKAHIEQREHEYYTLLGRLVANRGFTVERDDFDMVSVPLLHLQHPAYGLEAELLRIPEHETVPDESIKLLREMDEASEGRYLEQDEYFDGLKADGWEIAVIPDHSTDYSDDDYEAIGRGKLHIDSERTFELRSEEERTTIEVPAYGELITVDIERIKATMDYDRAHPIGTEPDAVILPIEHDGGIDGHEGTQRPGTQASRGSG